MKTPLRAASYLASGLIMLTWLSSRGICQENKAEPGRQADVALITTIAGTGQAGFGGDGGPAVAAQLHSPTAIVVAPDGSLYVADTGNHRIRRIAPDGKINSVAGTGQAGFAGDGGPAHLAQLHTPRGLALAADGTLYLVDSMNHRVRRIAADGTIATIGGTGSAGFSGDGGPAVEARFNRPSAVAVAPDGRVYVADRFNHRLRMIAGDGTITTVAGTGRAEGFDPLKHEGGRGPPPQKPPLPSPVALASGPKGGIYVATEAHLDRFLFQACVFRLVGQDRIDRIAGVLQEGGMTDQRSLGDGGHAWHARFPAGLRDISVGPDGGLYIVHGYRVRRLPANKETIETVAGSRRVRSEPAPLGDGGPATQAVLRDASGLAVGGNGVLYIADTGNHRIRMAGRRELIDSVPVARKLTVRAEPGDTAVQLSWDAPPQKPVQAYRVYRAGLQNPLAELKHPRFRHQGLSNGKKITYRVVAVLPDGTEWSGYEQVVVVPREQQIHNSP